MSAPAALTLIALGGLALLGLAWVRAVRSIPDEYRDQFPEGKR